MGHRVIVHVFDTGISRKSHHFTLACVTQPYLCSVVSDSSQSATRSLFDAEPNSGASPRSSSFVGHAKKVESSSVRKKSTAKLSHGDVASSVVRSKDLFALSRKRHDGDISAFVHKNTRINTVKHSSKDETREVDNAVIVDTRGSMQSKDQRKSSLFAEPQRDSGDYSQLAISQGNDRTTYHGQADDGKNTQIIITLNHEPKAYVVESGKHQREYLDGYHESMRDDNTAGPAQDFPQPPAIPPASLFQDDPAAPPPPPPPSPPAPPPSASGFGVPQQQEGQRTYNSRQFDNAVNGYQANYANSFPLSDDSLFDLDYQSLELPYGRRPSSYDVPQIPRDDPFSRLSRTRSPSAFEAQAHQERDDPIFRGHRLQASPNSHQAAPLYRPPPPPAAPPISTSYGPPGQQSPNDAPQPPAPPPQPPAPPPRPPSPPPPPPPPRPPPPGPPSPPPSPPAPKPKPSGYDHDHSPHAHFYEMPPSQDPPRGPSYDTLQAPPLKGSYGARPPATPERPPSGYGEPPPASPSQQSQPQSVIIAAAATPPRPPAQPIIIAAASPIQQSPPAQTIVLSAPTNSYGSVQSQQQQPIVVAAPPTHSYGGPQQQQSIILSSPPTHSYGVTQQSPQIQLAPTFTAPPPSGDHIHLHINRPQQDFREPFIVQDVVRPSYHQPRFPVPTVVRPSRRRPRPLFGSLAERLQFSCVFFCELDQSEFTKKK